MKMSGSSHVVERKCVGVVKGYMQMPIEIQTVSVLSQSQLAVRSDTISHGERQQVNGCPAWVAAHSGPPVEYFPSREVEALSGDLKMDGQEKKLWVNMAVCLRLYVPVSHIPTEALTPRKNHYHHHVVPQARISLTLSRHFYLSFIASGRSSGPHPISSHSC